MRNVAKLILSAVVGVTLLTAAGASADKGCNADHTHTAAGSCKDGDDHQTTCGTEGALPVVGGGVRFYVNPTEDGGEVEACNDEGAGITQGRLVLKVSSDGYVRISLDSDKDQEQQVEAGYINIQLGPDPDSTGVWCAEPGGAGDGYSRPVDDPGDAGGTTPDQWPACAPGQ